MGRAGSANSLHLECEYASLHRQGAMINQCSQEQEAGVGVAVNAEYLPVQRYGKERIEFD